MVYLAYTLGHSPSLKKVKARTKAETMEESWLLPYSLVCSQTHCAMGRLFYSTQNHLPRDSAAHSGLNFPA